MSGRKRKAPDRLGGDVLPWHAVPGRPQSQHPRSSSGVQATRAPDSSLHCTAMSRVLSQEEVEAILQLQNFDPDELDEETAAFAGRGKDIWTLWPHCQQSKVPMKASTLALEKIRKVLSALDTCPACSLPPTDHRVHEVEMFRYTGAGAACTTHKDTEMDKVSVPLKQQGAVMCCLRQQCQGGILHVGRRICGRIVCRTGGRLYFT